MNQELDVKGKIREKAEEVCQNRKLNAEYKSEWDNLRRELEKENEIFLNKWKIVESMLERAETELRQLALEAYTQTQDKRPGPGVEVRLYDVLSYDSLKAFDWAVEHKQALQLSKPVFEKLAKVDKPDFVTTTQEPRALIATDLVKALAEEEK